MNILLNKYEEYKGISPLFHVTDYFDWYDGEVFGVAKLTDTEYLFLFQLVSWDFNSDLRIFSILELTRNFFQETADRKVGKETEAYYHILEEYIMNYQGEMHLFKTRYITDKKYELIKWETPEYSLFNNIEDIANQSEERRQQFFDLF